MLLPEGGTLPWGGAHTSRRFGNTAQPGLGEPRPYRAADFPPGSSSDGLSSDFNIPGAISESKLPNSWVGDRKCEHRALAMQLL